MHPIHDEVNEHHQCWPINPRIINGSKRAIPKVNQYEEIDSPDQQIKSAVENRQEEISGCFPKRIQLLLMIIAKKDFNRYHQNEKGGIR